MRTHLGCIGSIALGTLGQETQKRLVQVQASWLEYSPEPPALDVRHVQPDNTPALREIAGELLDFLRTISDDERTHIPGGAFYYQDEPTGQYIRLRVWKGGFLTVHWARPDYTHVEWQQFRNQPVAVVFDPFQRLNGSVSFEDSPAAAENAPGRKYFRDCCRDCKCDKTLLERIQSSASNLPYAMSTPTF